MIGLEVGKVRVVAHDPGWKDVFRGEKDDLRAALRDMAPTVTIEHVGSTAVDGLAAKPIIDIALGFRSLRDLRRGLGLLIDSGRDYVKAANQPGMLFMAKGEDGRRSFHYHLVIYGTPAWRKLLVFRDYLRRHPGVAADYGKLKTALAGESPDSRSMYMARKRPALRAIMQRGFAESARRRQAASIALTLALGDEGDALDEWRRARQSTDAAIEPDAAAMRAGTNSGPDEPAEPPDALDDFEPHAEA